MGQLRRLVAETHRRSLWQVLGVYSFVAWIVWQVVVSLYEGVGLPDWVPPTALVLLLIGLPIVLATAFVQEGAPGIGRDGGEWRATIDGLETATETVVAERRGEESGVAAELEPSRDPSGAGPKPRRAGILTWPRALSGGVLAFAALGLATTGFMGTRALGVGPAATLISSGLMEEREPLVLAEFEVLTGDTALAAIATQAFRIDVQQSPTVTLATEDRVAGILERMGRSPDTRLDEDAAREVALRAGLKAYVAGDVSAAGSAVVFSARIVAAEDGRVLAAYRATARDTGAIVDAIDRLSEKVRSKVGESLRSVRATPRLAEITSPSLPAIRKLVEGTDQVSLGSFERGLELLREAVTIDTAFAFAYRKLAAALNNIGQTGAAYEAITRALDHPERLSEYERLHAEGMAGHITGDRDRAVRAYLALLEADPEDFIALNNVALNLYHGGDVTRAAEYGLRNLAVFDDLPATARYTGSYTNAARYLFAAGRTAAADSVLRLIEDERDPYRHYALSQWASAHGRYDEAADHATAMAESRPATLPWRRGMHRLLGSVEAVQGRVRAADARYARAGEVSERLDHPDEVLVYALRRAVLAGRVLGDTARARRLITEARAAEGAVTVEDYPYPLLAEAYVWAGQPDSARSALDRLEAEAPEWLRLRLSGEARAAAATLDLVEGRPEEALPILAELVREDPKSIEIHALRGIAYELLDSDSATASYRRYLDTPLLERGSSPPRDPLYLAFVHERLGSLYEQSGEREAAASHYAAFTDLWADADPELQPRVEAARRALARLTSEGGS